MRLWLVALFGVIHAITSFLAWIAIVEHVYPFFVRNRGTDPVLEAIEEGLVWFFLTTPLWGILWAWLWVRFRNHLFDTQPGPHCRECGYDLTGNVSGICPECGKATASSA